MIQQFIQWVKDLFGRITGQNTRRELSRSEKFKEQYENISRTNFTSIFSNALANKTVSDSTMTITDSTGGRSRRSEFIAMCLKSTWKNIKDTVDTVFGTGGLFIVPYVSNSRVYSAVIDQTACNVLGTDGDGNITSIAIRAETAYVGDDRYVRTMYMELSNNVLLIRQKAVDQYGKEVALATVPNWADIEPEHMIGNVQRIPVAYLKCPKSDRKSDTFYGVPITYGCDETIQDLHECMDQIRKEFRLKEAFVGIDELLLGKNGQLPIDGLFKLFSAGSSMGSGKTFFEIFDPPFRDSSYYNRFHELLLQLEQEVGTSSGILTKPDNDGSTAYEIKSQNKETFDIVDDMRTGIENCFNILAYAVDMYAEHFGLTPAGAAGDYSVTFDWDMSMIESSTETYAQYAELESRGYIRPARLVSFVTGMSLEESQDEIDAATEEAAQKADQISADELEP